MGVYLCAIFTETQVKTISSYCHRQLRATGTFETETCRILKDSSSESRVKDKLNVGRAKEKDKIRAGHKITRSTWRGGGGGRGYKGHPFNQPVVFREKA